MGYCSNLQIVTYTEDLDYYSNVRIVTNGEGYERFIELVPEEDLTRECMMFTFLDVLEVNVEGNTVLFGWDNIKWCVGQPDIDAAMAALTTLDKEGYPIEYLRFGDDVDDVDDYRSNCIDTLAFHIELKREFEVWPPLVNTYA